MRLHFLIGGLLLAGCTQTPEGGLPDAAQLASDAGLITDAGAPADGSVAPDAGAPTCGAEAPAGDPFAVRTSKGAVRGIAAGPEVRAFLGVPFAAPPVGALRWRAPEPPACLDDLFEANEFAPACPQLDADGVPFGDESCLALNVWTPTAATPAGGRPVMFFIHGGGNAAGSTSNRVNDAIFYDGRFLAAEQDVVVVTAAYRLGPLGWLVHPELEAATGGSGNYGTLDQIRALEWVQEEIAAFGGDPARVMIFGESAGARNVCVLVASPLAAGLFSAAIMQSGGCSVPPVANVRADSAEQVRRSGCEGAANGEIPCLAAISPSRLLLDFPPVIDVAGRSSNLQPHVDGRVLIDQPDATIAAGAHHQVQMIIGANSDETSRSVPMIPTPEAYAALVEATFGRALGQRVLAEYPTADFPSPRAAYVAVTTDSKFVCTSRRDARAAAAGSDAGVYRYFFTHAQERAPVLRELGAFHGAELPFVFGNLEIGNYRPSAAEVAFSQQLGGYWARFAGTGDPNGGGAPAWPEYDSAADRTLVMEASSTRVEDGIRTAHCDFWDALFP